MEVAVVSRPVTLCEPAICSRPTAHSWPCHYGTRTVLACKILAPVPTARNERAWTFVDFGPSQVPSRLAPALSFATCTSADLAARDAVRADALTAVGECAVWAGST